MGIFSHSRTQKKLKLSHQNYIWVKGRRATMAAPQETQCITIDTVSTAEWFEKYSKFKWALSKNNLQNRDYINNQKWFVNIIKNYLELHQNTPNHTPNIFMVTLEMYYVINEYIPELFMHKSTKWCKFINVVSEKAVNILDGSLKTSKYMVFKNKPYYASLHELLCETIATCNYLKSSQVNCENLTPLIVGIDGTIRFPASSYDTAGVPIPIIPLYL